MRTSISQRLRWSIPVAAALVTGASGVRADPIAQALFEEGRRLVAEGKNDEACAKFEESQRIEPAPGTLFNLAGCHEKQGRTATAWAEFTDSLAVAQRDGRTERAQIAREHVAALEPRLARMTVVVQATAPRGLAVTRDGVSVGAGQWNVAVPLDPGRHVISASAPGKVGWQREVVLVDAASVVVEVPLLEDEAGAAPFAAERREPERPAGSAQRWLGVGVGAVGVAALVVGTVFGLGAIAKKDAAAPHCDAGDGCTDEGLRLRGEGITRGNVSTVAFVAGGVLVAGGVVLFATAPSAKSGGAATIGARGAW